MIELFNSRRMTVVVIILIMVCVIVIILDDLFTDNVDKRSPRRHFDNNMSKTKPNSLQTLNSSQLNEIKVQNIRTESKCWTYESFKVVSDCLICDTSDIITQELIACKPNGFRQQIDCKTIGLVYRWCDSSEHNF